MNAVLKWKRAVGDLISSPRGYFGIKAANSAEDEGAVLTALCVPPHRCAAIDAWLPRQDGNRLRSEAQGARTQCYGWPLLTLHRPAQWLLLQR